MNTLADRFSLELSDQRWRSTAIGEVITGKQMFSMVLEGIGATDMAKNYRVAPIGAICYRVPTMLLYERIR